MSKRLEFLRASLTKNQEVLTQKIDTHFETVKQANGQPLNDKRNGRATLNKWEKQSDSIKSQVESIKKTQEAIEYEEGLIRSSENALNSIPAEIATLVQDGILIQWRRYPNTFFVEGVEKGRIVWDFKKKAVFHKFYSSIPDKEQREKFRNVYNGLNQTLNK